MTTNHYRKTEFTHEQTAEVSGGLLTLIPIAVAFGKGFVGGVGAAAAVHVAMEAYELLTS